MEQLEIIGVSRRAVDAAELVRQSGCDESLFAERMRMVQVDLAKPRDYARLKREVADDSQILVYLAIPPGASRQVITYLGQAGLNTPNVKLLLEKPFGYDLLSAEDLARQIGRYFDESQVYRIDHYLAKEMAQNVVALRFGNAVFADMWSNQSIERIEVNAYEQIDIEGRGEFYEQTGALRDIVQGHLLQLLALVLMDAPGAFDWRAVPDLRRQAIEQLAPADPRAAKRAQYNSYRQEVGNPASQTETYVQVPLHSNDPRWIDVPLVVTTGKALAEKRTEIRVFLRSRGSAEGNQLAFLIYPREGVEIELYLKRPGYERTLEPHALTSLLPQAVRLPDAYEQVLVDAIRGEHALFASAEEVLASWRVVQPLLDAWALASEPIATYPKGQTPPVRYTK